MGFRPERAGKNAGEIKTPLSWERRRTDQRPKTCRRNSLILGAFCLETGRAQMSAELEHGYEIRVVANAHLTATRVRHDPIDAWKLENLVDAFDPITTVEAVYIKRGPKQGMGHIPPKEWTSGGGVARNQVDSSSETRKAQREVNAIDAQHTPENQRKPEPIITPSAVKVETGRAHHNSSLAYPSFLMNRTLETPSVRLRANCAEVKFV